MPQIIRKVWGSISDWGTIVIIATAILGVVAFLFNISSTQKIQADQINSLTSSVSEIGHVLPEVQRSLGRIEGALNSKQNEDKHAGR